MAHGAGPPSRAPLWKRPHSRPQGLKPVRTARVSCCGRERLSPRGCQRGAEGLTSPTAEARREEEGQREARQGAREEDSWVRGPMAGLSGETWPRSRPCPPGAPSVLSRTVTPTYLWPLCLNTALCPDCHLYPTNKREPGDPKAARATLVQTSRGLVPSGGTLRHLLPRTAWGTGHSWAFAGEVSGSVATRLCQFLAA